MKSKKEKEVTKKAKARLKGYAINRIKRRPGVINRDYLFRKEGRAQR